MTSVNPANPLTRAEFYNACTSVLQGLSCLQGLPCLQRQGTTANDAPIKVLEELGFIVSDLRLDVQSNKEFYVDGPLVRFLTAQVSKGKTVIQEMKRTCSPQSASINGPVFVDRHLLQHIDDIKSVIEELIPYRNNRIYQQDTQHVDAEIQNRLMQQPLSSNSTLKPILKNSQTPPSSKSGQISFNDSSQPFQIPTEAPMRAPLVDMLVQSKPEPPSGDNSNTPYPPRGDSSNTPGVFEHMNEERKTYPQHSTNWPKYENKPPMLLERSQPPLVYNGLRDMQNYTNLPQYTGMNLPMPTMPNGEFGLVAPHTRHWDYHNNRMY